MKALGMTQAQIKKIPALYSQENVEDPIAVVKFFNPCGAGTWYATEGTKQADGDWLFFGMCEISDRELGYFTLSELASVKLKWGLRIERDLYFSPKPLSEALRG